MHTNDLIWKRKGYANPYILLKPLAFTCLCPRKWIQIPRCVLYTLGSRHTIFNVRPCVYYFWTNYYSKYFFLCSTFAVRDYSQITSLFHLPNLASTGEAQSRNFTNYQRRLIYYPGNLPTYFVSDRIIHAIADQDGRYTRIRASYFHIETTPDCGAPQSSRPRYN